MDKFLEAAIEEAETGLKEGGIPIGSVLVYKNSIIGRGHNRRVQQGSVILHGEMDALEKPVSSLLRSTPNLRCTPHYRPARCAPAPFCSTRYPEWSSVKTRHSGVKKSF